ncbi:MAG: amylo-alpha-1,6-glucosidase [Candidatus Krumholzibacteriia bacterium]
MSSGWRESAEWLEADGLGGFAMGTADGVRTRRYHGLLLAAVTPPSGRMMLVNGCEAWLETPRGTYALTSQRYAPDTVQPDGRQRIRDFGTGPWPHWTYELPDGMRIEHELFVPRGAPAVALSWRLGRAAPGVRLFARPLISGRDCHGLHHENGVFNFGDESRGARVLWRPYPGVPGILSLSNAHYARDPAWYRRVLYSEERARGLDDTEDLASPGTFSWDLSAGEAVWMLAAADGDGRAPALSAGADAAPTRDEALARHGALRAGERRRRGRPASALRRAAAAYVVRRGEGRTIIAGYPWFGEWGRDTFIALRGLCLATGRGAEARDILLAWAPLVSAGMLPNRFAERGGAAEYNTVDASLWFALAVGEFLRAAASGRCRADRPERDRLVAAVEAILTGYAQGTRFGIRLDDDGLLAAGEPGVQLTWMDARVDDHVVTPRVGKPVEVQALWLNALQVRSGTSARWRTLLERGTAALRQRFWNAAGDCLYDVVDVDHERGRVDASLRPNQIFAAGGLPYRPLAAGQAARVVATVEARLLTPLGLRSLAPGEPGYVGRYQGGVRERDGAYHQGTVWPWLLGPFVEAWVRVRGGGDAAKREARDRFLGPLLQHLDDTGLGHLPEIADGDPPHAARGCPFQAWSVAEALRLDLDCLAGAAAQKG